MTRPINLMRSVRPRRTGAQYPAGDRSLKSLRRARNEITPMAPAAAVACRATLG
jgi:hypothetical protein